MHRPLMYRLYGPPSNGEYQYIRLPRLKSGQLALVREVGISSLAAGTINPNLVINPDGEAIVYTNWAGAGAGGGEILGVHLWLGEGDELAAKYTGNSATGAVVFWVNGWLYEKGPDEVIVVQPANPQAPSA